MESGPEVDLSAKEKFHIEQYTKIAEFAEAVLNGSHPRIKLGSRCSPGSIDSSVVSFIYIYSSGPLNAHLMWEENSAPSPPDVEFISASSLMHGTTEDTPNRQPIAIGSQDEGLNYYQQLGIEFPASHKEVHMAYSRLRLTYDPYTSSGQLLWLGNDISILYQMENDWKAIKHAHLILNSAEGKRIYDKHLMSLLQNKAQKMASIYPIFPLVRSSDLMPSFTPVTDTQRFFSRLPDMSDELEKIVFINNATRGIVIEESNINFSRNYYHDLGVEQGKVKLDTLERSFICKSKGGALNPQTCKGKFEEQRVKQMWSTAIEAFMILKHNRLCQLYDLGRNNAMLEIAEQHIVAGQARLDPFLEPASMNISHNKPSNQIFVTPKGPSTPTAVGGLTHGSFEAQRIHIQRGYQRLEAARITFENLSGQKLPPVAPRMMISPSTPAVRRQSLISGPSMSFPLRSGVAVGPPPATSGLADKSTGAARPHAESLAQPPNELLGREKHVSGESKRKENGKVEAGKGGSRRRRERAARRSKIEREGEVEIEGYEDGEIKEGDRKGRGYRRRRSSR
ncbi:hypothetical protein ACMFMF_000046 [Clarireedia jacksonii]